MTKTKRAPAKKPGTRKAKRQPAAQSGFTNPYVVKAVQYAERVVSGDIPACKGVRLACRRQLRDIEQWRTDETYPYRFDEGLAGRACEFLEQLPHTQGPLSFQREDGSWNTLVLEPWQCFAETALYGWIRKDSPPQRPVRRFTRSYEELPRGNGKSFKLSGALLYSFAESEQGVESYSAAVDRDQAAKVYGEAAAMLVKNPGLAQALGLESNSHAIIQRSTHSRAVALSRDAKKSGDGKNVYFAAVDELHAHVTREVFDVLDTGTGKRGGNALIRIITTAGFNTAGVCYEKRTYVMKILEGVVRDDTWFGIIYTIDEDDDWSDEACRAACSDHSYPGCVWRKANPNWGVSVDPIDFHAKMMRAIVMPSERNNLLTKHLCVWCNADVAWMDMSAWDACGEPGLREEDFAGKPCAMGLDLATKVDLVASAKLFYRDLAVPHRDLEVPRLPAAELPPAGPGGAAAAATDAPPPKEPATERHYYLFVHLFLPENAARASNNAMYSGWVREGRIRTTPGDVLDFEAVRQDVLSSRDAHWLREVAYDPWQCQQLANELVAAAVPMVELRPSVQNYSAPMKELEALVLGGRFHHDANPVMRWMVSNVVCHTDHKGNVYPNKAREENKIDGVVAAISALNRAMLAPVESDNPYAGRTGFLTL